MQEVRASACVCMSACVRARVCVVCVCVRGARACANACARACVSTRVYV